ncbi:MAG: toll/interleukin-1 receptor domain-containing protein [Planctomycetes bacterium]|nr:toll/interleukin-1 receptor domain-containing protein [Planctomycetota bacterium]
MFDAFLSYSSRDRAVVERIQHFIEDYRLRTAEGKKRRLRVFFDRTDMRGGDLTEEIRGGLERSQALVLCASPAAVDSRWVRRELEDFRRFHQQPRIAVVLLTGQETLLQDLGTDAETRFHDLRRGRLGPLWRPRARLELLKLLAYLTGVDLRTLRNWWLRRTLARGVLLGCVAAALATGVLAIPVPGWERVPLADRRGEVAPIASEMQGGKLWVAWRFQAGGERPRNYIECQSFPVDQTSKSTLEKTFSLRGRLLPLKIASRVDEKEVRSKLAAHYSEKTDEDPKTRPIWVGSPAAGWLVVVAPIEPSQEDAAKAEEESDEAAFTIPARGRSLVLVEHRGVVRTAAVAGLDPRWQERDAAGAPASPATGLPVAVSTDGSLWIGMPARPNYVSGGLWRTSDAGGTWEQLEDWTSVTSLLAVRDPKPELWVAESHHSRWVRGLLQPKGARLVKLDVASGKVIQVSLPVISSRAEVELSGAGPDGHILVRIDEAIYRQGERPLWHWVLRALGRTGADLF